MPPIHNAAKAGDVARVKAALETGTNVNAKDHVRTLPALRRAAAARTIAALAASRLCRRPTRLPPPTAQRARPLRRCPRARSAQRAPGACARHTPVGLG
jgi:hypothetical protein